MACDALKPDACAQALLWSCPCSPKYEEEPEFLTGKPKPGVIPAVAFPCGPVGPHWLRICLKPLSQMEVTISLFEPNTKTESYPAGESWLSSYCSSFSQQGWSLWIHTKMLSDWGQTQGCLKASAQMFSSGQKNVVPFHKLKKLFGLFLFVLFPALDHVW